MKITVRNIIGAGQFDFESDQIPRAGEDVFDPSTEKTWSVISVRYITKCIGQIGIRELCSVSLICRKEPCTGPNNSYSEMLNMLETIENDGKQVPPWLWAQIQAVIKKAGGKAK